MLHFNSTKGHLLLGVAFLIALGVSGCGGGGTTGSLNNTNTIPVVPPPATGGSGGTAATMQMNLPVSLDDATVIYKTVDFGGDASSIVTDPAAGAANGNVVKIVRGAPGTPSQTYAGTTLTDTIGGVQVGFSSKVPFTASGTQMSIDFYSPAAGVHVRLKAEDHTNQQVSVETEAVTTKANAWETLTFEFKSQSAGTAALDLTKSYDKVTVFPNFNTADSGAIYYFDNVKFVNATTVAHPTAQMVLPVTFDDATTIYATVDFGGDASAIVTDPAAGGTRANVVKVIRGAVGTPSATYAGTTVTDMVGGVQVGFAAPVPFSATGTRMSIDFYSPAAGLPVRMKAEDHTNQQVSVETEAVTTVANAWETLTFEFATQAAGTAALDITKHYDKVTVFPNFNTPDSGAIYYFDNLKFVNATTAPAGGGGTGGGGTTTGGFTNITFDSPTITYMETPFGGSTGAPTTDPVVGTNQVGSMFKPTTAELYAGVTIGTVGATTVGKIPFSSTQKTMTMRVYSPAAGVRYRIKVENSANNGITCETDAVSTVANGWETLTFNFATPAFNPPNDPTKPTAALDVSQTYDRLSVFPDFGLGNGGIGPQPADRTYYFDDITF